MQELAASLQRDLFANSWEHHHATSVCIKADPAQGLVVGELRRITWRHVRLSIGEKRHCCSDQSLCLFRLTSGKNRLQPSLAAYQAEHLHDHIGTANGMSCVTELTLRLQEIATSTRDHTAILNGRYTGSYITRHY